jgi:hypothetical protein
MHNKLLIFILFLFPVLNLYAQTEEELVTKIREQFKNTNANLNGYELLQKDIYTESTEGGLIKLYVSEGETVMMHCEFYGEGGNLMEEFYFWNGQLYFVYTVQELYDRPIYMEGSQVSEKNENRYYFDNGKMIRWLDEKKQKVNITSEAFIKAEKEMLNESLRLMEVFTNAE